LSRDYLVLKEKPYNSLNKPSQYSAFVLKILHRVPIPSLRVKATAATIVTEQKTLTCPEESPEGRYGIRVRLLTTTPLKRNS
jgi:hypothetical protein